MPTANTEPPSNVTERRQPMKRKRETPASRSSANTTRNNTPNAYARRSPPREQKRARSPSPIRDDDERGERSPPRKLKRPGAGARINAAEAAERARRREEEERKAVRERQTTAAELVAEHYNAVPERGREWRKTDSQIKGLRSLNNWVKSTLIQKFSRPEIPVQQMLVLDMACGKGGDLGKWEKAPQVPALYLGCDIADVSVEQAKQRWAETVRRSQGRHRRSLQVQAEFYVHDSFGRPLGQIPTVRNVGFNPNAGPGGGIIQPGTMSGGFDVVSMMFALHYSFESEELARGMLRNVSGALKKGGRFIGVMPNSDVISGMVKKLLHAEGKGKTPNERAAAPAEKQGGEEGEIEEEGGGDDWDPEKPSEANGTTAEDEDDWDPEKPSEPQPTTTNGTADQAEEDDDWDPEKPSEPAPATTSTSTTTAQVAPDSSTKPEDNGTPTKQPTTPDSNLPPLEWGNTLYTVRFPRAQPLTHRPLPSDGVFRPPYGWRYHYQLEEAVDVPEYVVPWEGFRALAEDYGLELMYRKGFREVLDEVMLADGAEDRELAQLAERMGVLSRDRSQGRGGLLVGEEELEAAGFYHAFCFYRT